MVRGVYRVLLASVMLSVAAPAAADVGGAVGIMSLQRVIELIGDALKAKGRRERERLMGELGDLRRSLEEERREAERLKAERLKLVRDIERAIEIERLIPGRLKWGGGGMLTPEQAHLCDRMEEVKDDMPRKFEGYCGVPARPLVAASVSADKPPVGAVVCPEPVECPAALTCDADVSSAVEHIRGERDANRRQLDACQQRLHNERVEADADAVDSKVLKDALCSLPRDKNGGVLNPGSSDWRKWVVEVEPLLAGCEE